VTNTLPQIGIPNGAPFPGHTTFSFGVAGGRSNNASVLLVGFNPITPPLTLPFSCALGVQQAATTFLTMRGGTSAHQGIARWELPVPNNQALIGVTLFAQWYTVDPGPSPVPGSMSDVLRTTVQTIRP